MTMNSDRGPTEPRPDSPPPFLRSLPSLPLPRSLDEVRRPVVRPRHLPVVGQRVRRRAVRPVKRRPARRRHRLRQRRRRPGRRRVGVNVRPVAAPLAGRRRVLAAERTERPRAAERARRQRLFGRLRRPVVVT